MGIMNRDGALFLATGIDNSGLNSGFSDAEKRIDQFRAYAEKAGLAIGGYFGIQGISGFVKEMVNVRSEFQNTEAMFKVFLGSGEKAKSFMKEMQGYAFNNVFEFKDLTGQAAQLLAFGTDVKEVTSVIDKLSNVAAGVNQPLERFVELYNKAKSRNKLDATDVQQWSAMGDIIGYLAEMLGKSTDETKKMVSEGKIGFKEMDQLLTNLTSSGGKFHGMMEEKMKTLGDSVGLLQDSITAMFNELGEKSEDYLRGGILFTNTLVENYEQIGKVLLALIATYGAYRTAIVLTTIATNGLTLAESLWYAKSEMILKIQKLINATMLKNPYVLAATLLIGVVTAMWALNDSTTAAERALASYNKKKEEAVQKEQEHKSKIEELISTATNQALADLQRVEALETLKQKYPEIFAKYDIELLKLADILSIKKQIAEQDGKDALKNRQNQYEEARANVEKAQKDLEIAKQSKSMRYERVRDAQRNLLKAQADLVPYEKQMQEDRINTFIGGIKRMSKAQIEAELQARQRLTHNLGSKTSGKIKGGELAGEFTKDELAQQTSALETELAKRNQAKFNYADLEKEYNSELKSLQAERKEIEKDAIKYTSDELKKKIEDVDARIKAKQEELKDLTGKTANQLENAANKAEATAEKILESQRRIDEADKQRQVDKLAFDNEMRQREIDNMDDGYDKRIAILKLNYEKEDQAIKEFEKKAAKEQFDYAKNKFINRTGSDKGFESYYAKVDLSTIMPDGLKPADIASQVNDLYAAAKAANKKGLDDINKDIAISINQERLQFAGELDQRLSDSQAYFAERRRQVKKGSDEYFELLSLEAKAIESIKAQHSTKVLQMENEYKEKAVVLSSELFFFQADKDAALLKQKIENNKAYIESLKKELKKLSGFDYDTLDDTSLDKLMKEYPDLVNAIRQAKLEQKGFNVELAKTPAEKFKDLLGLFDQLSKTLLEITGIDFSVLSSFGGIVASLADHDYLGAASSGLSLIGSFFTSINSSKSRQKEIQEQINKLQLEYNDSLRQQKFDIIESVNYARIYKDNIETLNFLIAKGIVDAKDYSIWEAGNAEYLEAKKNVEDYRGEIENLDKGLFSYADRLWSGKITGDEVLRMQKGKFDLKSSLDAIARYKQGLIDSVQLAKELKAAGWQDGGITEQLENATEKTEEWKEKLAEARSKLDEMSTGVSFDGFLGNAINALEEWARKGKTEISDLADFTEEALITAILSAYKYQILAEKLQPFYEELSDKMVNDPNSITADWAKDWGDRLTGQLEGDLNTLNYILENLGIDLTAKNDSTQSSSKGGFNTMTQDQAGELSGRFTGLHETGLHILAINQLMQMDTSKLREYGLMAADGVLEIKQTLVYCMDYLADIARSNNELYEMNERLGDIERNTRGLVSR